MFPHSHRHAEISSPCMGWPIKFTFSFPGSQILLRRLSLLHFHGFGSSVAGIIFAGAKRSNPAPLHLYCTDTSYRIPPSKNPFSFRNFKAVRLLPLVFPFRLIHQFFQLYFLRQHHPTKFTISPAFWSSVVSSPLWGMTGTLKRSPIDRRNRQTDAVNRDRSLLQ